MVPTLHLNNGRSIPGFGYGLYLVDKKDVAHCVKSALESGYRLFDTAEYYENEVETAIAIKDWLDEDSSRKRSDIFYTTKISSFNLNYQCAVESTRKRIKLVENHLGYIDLLLLHLPAETTEDRLGAYQAVQEYIIAHPDKLKSIGVSNYGVNHMKEVFEWEGLKVMPTINQIELSPWLTRKGIVDYCIEHSVIMEAWGPLTRATKIDDSELEQLSNKYKVSTAQILLNWSAQKGFLPIAKSCNSQRIKENIEAFDFKMSKEDVDGLTHDGQYCLSQTFFDPSTKKSSFL